MRRKAFCHWAAALILALSAPAFPHHSLSLDYDSSKPTTLSGKVTKVEWRNPHVFFYVDASDPGNTQVNNWAIEMGSLNSLIRLGWTQNSLKVGHDVKVQGILAIDRRRMVLARTVTLARTGQQLLTWEGEAAVTR